MANLSHETAAEYWFNFSDPTIYRVLMFLESVEDFTLDGEPNLEAALQELGNELEDMQNVNLDKVNKHDNFIRIVGNIKSSRGLYLLQMIDSAEPGSASKVLTHAEKNTLSPYDPAGVFLKRNIAFERLRLLSRVFSEYRLYQITRALEGDE
ncbi:MAG: phosphoesterase [Legionellales bacterium RIFCSPHIGHO2_12_FULL_37_14]|nr:MAG: phosphoesterase [Legionellales bacterium RIFCSPHIGHO2_12_FULL_37_14]